MSNKTLMKFGIGTLFAGLLFTAAGFAQTFDLSAFLDLDTSGSRLLFVRSRRLPPPITFFPFIQSL